MWWFTQEALNNWERERFQKELERANRGWRIINTDAWSQRFAELVRYNETGWKWSPRTTSAVNDSLWKSRVELAEWAIKDIIEWWDTNKLFNDPSYIWVFNNITENFMIIWDSALIQLKQIIANKIGFRGNPSSLRVSVRDWHLECQWYVLWNIAQKNNSNESNNKTPMQELPEDIVMKLESVWLKRWAGMRMISPTGKLLNFWFNNNTYTIDIRTIDTWNRDNEKWYEVILNQNVPWQKKTILRFMESWSQWSYGIILDDSGNELEKIY